MALRNIIKVPDPLLYKKCRKVEKFDESLSILIDDMFETMKNVNITAHRTALFGKNNTGHLLSNGL